MGNQVMPESLGKHQYTDWSRSSHNLMLTVSGEVWYMIKGWMTRQILFGLSESVCLKTYRSRIKVHTEQGM